MVTGEMKNKIDSLWIVIGKQSCRFRFDGRKQFCFEEMVHMIANRVSLCYNERTVVKASLNDMTKGGRCHEKMGLQCMRVDL